MRIALIAADLPHAPHSSFIRCHNAHSVNHAAVSAFEHDSPQDPTFLEARGSRGTHLLPLMSSSSEIRSAFAGRVSKDEAAALDSADLTSACVNLCSKHAISAAELVAEWEAFTCNNDAKLSLQGIGQLDTLMLKRSAAEARKGTRSSAAAPRTVAGTPMLSRNSMGGFGSPKLSQTKRPPTATPLGTNGLKVPKTEATPSPGFSISQSPTSVTDAPPTPMAAYGARTNAGQCVVEHNPSKLGSRGFVEPSSSRGGLRCSVVPDRSVGAQERYRFMFTPLEERSRLLEQGIQSLQTELIKQHSLEDLSPVGIPCQEEVTVVGRIVCEAGEGRINKSSTYLEGSRRDSGGQRVLLSLQDMPAFALFPGQVIAARGINSGGAKMVVHQIMAGAPKPLPSTLPDELMELLYGDERAGGKPVSIMVAAGPYTVSGDLEYAPLNDLLAIARTTRPDVVLLIGPFVDDAHPLVAAGEAGMAGDDGVLESVDFETLFRIRVCDKLQLLLEDTDLATQFLLVPSLHDAFHDYAYPQAPLSDRIPGGVELGVGEFAEDRVYTLGIPDSPRVVCLANPAMVRINEVLVGVTSADVLLDLSSSEASIGGGGNRLARLSEHLILQQSFYPVQPPPVNSAAQLEPRQQARWRMPLTPDVLLLPGKLTPFAREVAGCLCVNPGHLAKGSGGGTFAHMTVHPLPQEELETAIEQAPQTPLLHRVAQRSLVEVRRI